MIVFFSHYSNQWAQVIWGLKLFHQSFFQPICTRLLIYRRQQHETPSKRHIEWENVKHYERKKTNEQTNEPTKNEWNAKAQVNWVHSIERITKDCCSWLLQTINPYSTIQNHNTLLCYALLTQPIIIIAFSLFSLGAQCLQTFV